MIKVFVDGVEARVHALNDVKAVVLHDAVGRDGKSHPYERHVAVTDEGIVIDIVVDGEVAQTKCFDHSALLEWDPTED